MDRKRTRPKNDSDEGADDWLLTYGDLMTQLVCFFVMLMTFATMSSLKFREVVVSLQYALAGTGVLSGWRSSISEVPKSIKHRIEDEKLLDLKNRVDEYIEENDMMSSLETKINEIGLIITLKQMESPVFFDTADASIKEGSYLILDKIGELIRDLPNDIRVEGHTDSRPINTPKFPSNWELSITRATNVLRYLQATAKIPPERLSAVGYGPYRPIAPNDTVDGMSRNRRVEIIIIRGRETADQQYGEAEDLQEADILQETGANDSAKDVDESNTSSS